MNAPNEVLVIGRPSRFRESICLLLASISAIEKVHLADDPALSPQMKELALVLLLDGDSGHGRLSKAVRGWKSARPRTQVIILVEGEEEFQAAMAAGSDASLRKGFPAKKFIEAVERRLPK